MILNLVSWNFHYIHDPKIVKNKQTKVKTPFCLSPRFPLQNMLVMKVLIHNNTINSESPNLSLHSEEDIGKFSPGIVSMSILSILHLYLTILLVTQPNPRPPPLSNHALLSWRYLIPFFPCIEQVPFL